ncbi:MAG: hypothetical protein HS104_33035 [Polyangiaceae bacterium]|nr:hypothetical protein [Polyangiaceae bacterium]MCE7890122.1 hypothetical protein [Sorangiineae bacterium PRO1]MCL4755003.1 hypothetical protein [Myxococcales bacterium]
MSASKLALAFLLAVAASSVACGGGDGDDDDSGGLGGGSVCEQACNKLEQCSPGSVCTVGGSGSCDGKAAEISQCILDKPCDQTNACLFGGV